MHTFEHEPSGVRFHYNSDLSGDVEVTGDDVVKWIGRGPEVPADALMAFFVHVKSDVACAGAAMSIAPDDAPAAPALDRAELAREFLMAQVKDTGIPGVWERSGAARDAVDLADQLIAALASRDSLDGLGQAALEARRCELRAEIAEPMEGPAAVRAASDSTAANRDRLADQILEREEG